MGYRVYVHTYRRLVPPPGVNLTYEVDFTGIAISKTLDEALEIAVSRARQMFGGADPSVNLVFGARGTLASVELTHPADQQVQIGGQWITFHPSVVIRHDSNPVEFSQVYRFANPCKAAARR